MYVDDVKILKSVNNVDYCIDLQSDIITYCTKLVRKVNRLTLTACDVTRLETIQKIIPLFCVEGTPLR